ncbi:MAG: cation-translocating P-type ATPase [bacterium]|nr:cation-translocating P-type ATPase [bacterium]MCM1375408.1 cation-translocating P-type ATPase [Muribaculum sp.]
MFEAMSIQETCRELQTDGERGLTRQEAVRRYSVHGKNALREKRKKTVVEAFFSQLNDPLIYVLLAAAVISIFLEETSDAIIIGVVVLLNAIVGMIQEGKAQRALDSLKKMVSPKAFVIREGILQEVEACTLVVGDLVSLEAGCQVPADMRLIESTNLKAEESALTGESLPAAKSAAFIGQEGIPLGDRQNMVYMSTVITGGRGLGIVTATGMDTEIGRIASLINEGGEEQTPLQKRLGDLGKVLSVLSLLLCAALFGIALLQRRNLFEMLLTAISLAVAAVPEGLPAVVTICLALSVTRMVKVHTIVRKLPSVETLGAVSIVCSDKTGTLTRNRMTVERCYAGQRMMAAKELGGSEHQALLEGMTLCNDAVLEESIGDPTELALLQLAHSFGVDRAELEKRMPRRRELPFDSDRKMMSTFHYRGNTGITFTKGAPDVVLERCSHIMVRGQCLSIQPGHVRQIRRAVEQMADEALRTLAIAMRVGGQAPEEQGLTFLGMVGMRDPARPEAAGAVATFRQAGVETVMITGDHVDTAYAIGRQLGIVQSRQQCMTGQELSQVREEELAQRLAQVRVFARVAPEQKVQIVTGFQQAGHIVAMTGDGVNDAPSLKKADIGIAMGASGTDVAKQAADMILTDDNFATIEKAIEEGRGVYENIRKSVIFLLSSNLGEIATMFLAVICGLASPLRSSHILWINLITDSLPALALGVDPNDAESLMQHPPRRAGESLFARGGLACTCFYGLLIAAISLAAFFLIPLQVMKVQHLPFTLESLGQILTMEGILRRSQTYAFTVLGMSQLFHAVGMRDMGRSFFRMNHLENKLMLLAFVLGFLLQFAVTEIPFLITAFGTTHLQWREWGILTLLASFPLLAHEVMILMGRARR